MANLSQTDIFQKKTRWLNRNQEEGEQPTEHHKSILF